MRVVNKPNARQATNISSVPYLSDKLIAANVITSKLDYGINVDYVTTERKLTVDLSVHDSTKVTNIRTET